MMKTKEKRKVPRTKEEPAGGGDLDPRLKMLQFDANAFCLWEEATGRTLGEMSESIKDFRVLIWAGLKMKIPDITLEDVGSMITPGNTGAVVALIKEKTGTDVGATTL